MMTAILILGIVNIIWSLVLAAASVAAVKQNTEKTVEEIKLDSDRKYKTLLKVILHADQIIEQADEACR